MGTLLFCPQSTVFDLANPCVRAFWSTILPAALVALFVFASIPIPKRVRKLLKPLSSPLQSFLTLQEAEALDVAAAAGNIVAGDDANVDAGNHPTVPLWRTLAFSWIALLETLVWLSLGSYNIVQRKRDVLDVVHPFVTAVAWLYASVRPVVRPQPTPPFDLFSLYFLNLLLEVFNLGGILYDVNVLGYAFPPPLILGAHVLNLAAVLVLLSIILAMPLDIPSERVDKEKIARHPSSNMFAFNL